MNGDVLVWYKQEGTSIWWPVGPGWMRLPAEPGDTIQLLLEGMAPYDPCYEGCPPDFLNSLTVTVHRDNLHCEPAWDGANVGVTQGEIISATLPNGFLAVPDRQLYVDTKCRVDPLTEAPIPEQETENEILVTYRCIPEHCECRDGESRIELWVDAWEADPGTCGSGPVTWFTRCVDRQPVPKPTEAPQEVTFSAKIGTEAQRWIQPRYYLKLASPCGESEQFPGPSSGLMAQPLIYDIDFSPRAHVPQEDGSLPGPDPVCPYTHEHPPLLRDDPNFNWYGLLLSYSLNANLEDLVVEVSGEELGAKRLDWIGSALMKACPPFPSDCRRIKWECFDASISEPNADPVFVFPNDFHAENKRAPIAVVKEGEYSYAIVATAGSSGDLVQKHTIRKLPIYVRYDLENDVILCPR